MKNCKYIVAVAAVLLFNSASASSGLEEYFYQSGKIKVVVAVAAIVLVGLFVYLQRLDNRLKKIEKNKEVK